MLWRLRSGCWLLFFLSTVLIVVTLLFKGTLYEQHTRKISENDLHRLTEALQTDSNGFMGSHLANQYCHKHNWKPYPKRDVRRKIYDLFLFNGELDWLDIRLHEIAPQVDYFVIVESPTAFTGIPKPLHIKENWGMLAPFHSKIIYHVLEEPSGFHSTITWDHEDLQRNAMFDQVFPYLKNEQKPGLGDVILVSDVDEIPRPSTLDLLRNCDYNRRLTLRSKFYYYGFQWLHRGPEWAHPQATYYEGSSTIRPADLRNGEGGSNSVMRMLEKADLGNAAWHCSSCFATLEQMLRKMSSSSHTKLNKAKFRERAGIVRRVRNGIDLFDRRTEYYDRVENNTDVPKYLRENRERFGYMLDRDPVNANFGDYTAEEAELARVKEQNKEEKSTDSKAVI